MDIKDIPRKQAENHFNYSDDELAEKKLAFEKIMETNQKYIESQQSRNKKPVYTQCQMCKKPKIGENHQKWPLCYKCNENKKSLNNGF